MLVLNTAQAVAILASLGLSSAMMVPTDFTDGVWTSTQHKDGTIITTSLSNLAAPAIITRSEAPYTENAATRLTRSAKFLGKRDGDCWGFQLDQSGVDTAVAGLLNWADSGGHDLCSPPNSNQWIGAFAEQTLVYYYIDTRGRCGNLDQNDVHFVLGQMDARCKPYEASWFSTRGGGGLIHLSSKFLG
ncbi:hypothetical protein BGZ60DRAFT_525289 [Tricladium varicosporioides]|nr:hypothetical protein BGZ60DRAFT_525289 [Hymenoscyphus varicosporioides]